ncbi:hypothetical protein LSAT2_032575 [Lamellibrachia satsuma]|nr:hypothetical protein LSAT2_032575 [Lamellibrachia satsuma]
MTSTEKTTSAHNDTSIEKTTSAHNGTSTDKTTSAHNDTSTDKTISAHNDTSIEKTTSAHNDTPIEKTTSIHNDTSKEKTTSAHNDTSIEKTTSAHNDTSTEKTTRAHNDTSTEKIASAHNGTSIEKTTSAHNDTSIEKTTSAHNDISTDKTISAHNDTSIEKTTSAHNDTSIEKTTSAHNDTPTEKTTSAYNDTSKEKTTIAHNDTSIEKTTSAQNDTSIEKTTCANDDTIIEKTTSAHNDTCTEKTTNSHNDSSIEKTTSAHNDTSIEKTTSAHNDTSTEKTARHQCSPLSGLAGQDEARCKHYSFVLLNYSSCDRVLGHQCGRPSSQRWVAAHEIGYTAGWRGELATFVLRGRPRVLLYTAGGVIALRRQAWLKASEHLPRPTRDACASGDSGGRRQAVFQLQAHEFLCVRCIISHLHSSWAIRQAGTCLAEVPLCPSINLLGLRRGGEEGQCNIAVVFDGFSWRYIEEPRLSKQTFLYVKGSCRDLSAGGAVPSNAVRPGQRIAITTRSQSRRYTRQWHRSGRAFSRSCSEAVVVSVQGLESSEAVK